MTGKPEGGPLRATRAGSRLLPYVYGSGVESVLLRVSSHGREVLLNGMSSKKHSSPPERQEYFFDIQPPAPVATFVLQRLDRFVPLRSGPRGRGATSLGCFLVRVVSCSLT